MLSIRLYLPLAAAHGAFLHRQSRWSLPLTAAVRLVGLIPCGLALGSKVQGLPWDSYY